MDKTGKNFEKQVECVEKWQENFGKTCRKFERHLGSMWNMAILFYPGAVGATNMNATSSRSHAIFTVQIDCNTKGPDGKDRFRTGKLHLVDLAVG